MSQFESYSRYDRQTVEITDVTLTKSTEKAGLYEIDGEKVWIPFSQLRKHPDTDEESVDKDGESGSLFLPRWLAEEKDLEYEETEED